MKKICILSVLGLSLMACNQSPKSDKNSDLSLNQSQTELTQVSEYTLEKSFKYLTSDELSGRETGTEGIEMAAAHIEEVFNAYKVKPLFNTFKDSFKLKELDAYNLVGVIKGSQPELSPILIGAHYDHIGAIKPIEGDSIANGANDNASGSVAVLELAKYFSKKQPKRDVIFALFSAEEKGLLGSEHLANRFKNDNIIPYFVFNIEMIGVPMKAKAYKAYVTGFENSNFAQVFNQASKDSVVGFLPQAQKMNLFMRSDNYPFYKTLNIPAHTVCTFDFTNFDYYHHVDDEFEKMDLKHLKTIINDFKPGLADLANTTDDVIKLN